MDFVQEMGVIQLTHKWVSFTQQISSLVLICDAKTWSYKNKKEKEKKWVYWLFWPLDCLYALNREWTLYKRWVTDQWELITHKGVSFTQQISSLALICDAKTWSQKKKRKRKSSECVDCFGHWTVFMHWTESGLCTRDGWLRADHPQRSQFHPTNLFLSLNLCCKDLVLQEKKKKGKAVSVWLFWPLDCLYALNREWTLYKRWVP